MSLLIVIPRDFSPGLIVDKELSKKESLFLALQVYPDLLKATDSRHCPVSSCIEDCHQHGVSYLGCVSDVPTEYQQKINFTNFVSSYLGLQLCHMLSSHWTGLFVYKEMQTAWIAKCVTTGDQHTVFLII